MLVKYATLWLFTLPLSPCNMHVLFTSHFRLDYSDLSWRHRIFLLPRSQCCVGRMYVCGVDGFQALQAGTTVRPPEDKPAASEGADGEVRGSRSSLVRMRDVDPPEVPLRQAPYNPPQDVASNSGSLVQVAEQAHPLVQRCPSPNPMREHRNNRTHEEVVVGGGATPHG